MAKIAKERGFKLILRSHGRRMPLVADKETGETWAEISAKYFDEIIISIDGSAEANFKMRPVINLQKSVQKNNLIASDVANKQFDETISGYEALTKAIKNRTDIELKINTVIAKDNLDDMEKFASLLSDKVADKTFRIDQWDITQVFASPETSKEEQDKYMITEEDFFRAVMEASLNSKNIPKRAKAQTSDRCLITDQNGRTYIGGKDNLELGTLSHATSKFIKEKISNYNEDKNLSFQRRKQYLLYKPQ